MSWPEKIIILEDETDNAKRIQTILSDLSWLTDFSGWLKKRSDGDEFKMAKANLEGEISPFIKNIAEQIKKNFKEYPDCFKGKIEKIIIINDEDVVGAESKIKEIVEKKIPTTAFIDFAYDTAASKFLLKKFDGLEPNHRWKIEAKPNQKGGCYLSAIFDESREEKRLNCMTSLVAPMDNAPKTDVVIKAGSAGSPANAFRSVLNMLEKWYELFMEPTLEKIWDSTKGKKGDETNGWFHSDYSSKVITPKYIPHTFSDKWIENERQVTAYKDNIKNIFGLTLPEEWFKNADSFLYLHESIKSMCGSYYCGTPTKVGKYNLTIGSVYLIALMAMRDVGDYCPLKKDKRGNIIELHKYPDINSEFLPVQTPQDAKNAAKTLYKFLLNLFNRDKKHQYKELKEFELDNKGKKLIFTFEWSASKTNKGKILTEQEPERIFKKDLYTSMIRSKIGFGCPGSIWMSGKQLFIASANSTAEVLIICNDKGDKSDDRSYKWLKLLFETGIINSVIWIKRENEILKFKGVITNYDKITIDDFPEKFCCTFAHTGNRALWKKINKRCITSPQKLFWFSSPGLSDVDEGYPIMRETSPTFAISAEEVEEVVNFSLGRTSEIPRICRQKERYEYLSAISILCQGFLSLHAVSKDYKPDASVDAALEQMGYFAPAMDNDKQILNNAMTNEKDISGTNWWDVFRKEIDNDTLKQKIKDEWGGEPGGELLKLLQGIYGENEIKAETVAGAYLAIVGKIKGK
jgi:hypothetical protein